MSSSESDLEIIKRKIVQDNKVEDILLAIGCTNTKYEQRGNMISAQLPDHFNRKNKRAVQVYLTEYLTCRIRNIPDFGTEGNIFTLVSYIYHNKRGDEIRSDLPNAKDFICNTLGWHQFLKNKKGYIATIDYTAPLKEILRGVKKKKEIKPNPVLPESILEDYYYYGCPVSFKGWIEEGISHQTQVIYGIGFDLDSKRVTIPLRNRFGKLVGVKGRIMKDEDAPDYKYIYLHPCNNRYEWFNFFMAHTYILMEKRVYIFESEKSPMKAFEHEIYNTLAIGASDITPEQAQILKSLGLDIEIVLCYDKGITLNEIKKQAELFSGRKVFAMIDDEGLLQGAKSAPIDEGIYIWNQLVKNSVFEIPVEN